MSINFKKILLAGTALVAASAISTQAQAIVVFTNTPTAITSGATGTWAQTTNGVAVQATHATILTAGAGDTVNLDAGATLTVTNNGTAADGSDTLGNVFVLGAVTNTALTGNITLTQVDTKLLQTTTIASANIGGTFTQTTAAGTATNQNTATVTGALTVGTNVALTNSNVTAGVTSSLTAGSITVTGTTGINSAALAANEQALVVNGNSTFTGLVTATSVTGSANNAILTLKGATNVMTAGAALTTGVASTNRSAINLTGTVAQTVSGGDIRNTTVSTGLIQVKNAAGATFTNTIGVTGGLALRGITIGAGTANSSATFKNTVNAPITLGATAGTVAGVTFAAVAVTDTNTVIFDGTTQAFTVTGAIAGNAAGEVDNISVVGGKAITLATASTANLDNLSITGTGTSLVTTAGQALTVTNTTIGSGATLTQNSAVTSIIDGASAGVGTLSVGTSSTTTGAIGATHSLALVKVADAQTLTATSTIAATNISLGASGGISETGAFVLPSGSTLRVTPSANTTTAAATGTGALNLASGSYIYVAPTYTPVAGHTYTVALGTGAETIASTVQSGLPGWKFTVAVGGTNDAVVTAAADTITSNYDLAQVQLTTVGAFNAATTALNAAIAAAPTLADKNTLVESALPTVDGSAQAAAVEVGSLTTNIAETRMASLRSGDGMTGMAAGSSANGNSMWVQAYGQTSTQDARGAVDGYTADVFGGVLGFDSTAVVADGTLGVAFNYGKTTADSKNANTTSTDVDTYGFNVFGSHNLSDGMFLNGLLGYAYNDINMTRHAVGGVAGQNAIGNTSSNQYSAKVGLGRDYFSSGVTLTPMASVAYNAVDTGGYTETGVPGLNLTVGSDTVRSLNFGLGGKAVWNLKQSDGAALKPSIRASYAYDALGDKVSVNSTLAGGGLAFASQNQAPDRSTFSAGVGMTYVTTADWDLSANYDYTYKANYNANSGSIRATAHF